MYKNLSFLVSQILTSHNFFSIWPIYMIFMGVLFYPHKKRVKFEIFKKSPNSEKTLFFLKFTLWVPLLPFLYFFVKNRWIKHIFFIYANKSIKKYFTLFLSSTFVKIRQNWLIWLILWLKKKTQILYINRSG